ncbi:MAG: VWA domain-containing protein [Gemmatimonadales bacterium]|jgi:Ca-activated chloride channel family protein
MTFASPFYLALMVVVLPPAIVLFARRERRRNADLAAVGDTALLERSSLLPGARGRAVANALAFSALALVLLALSRPQFGTAPSTLTSSGQDVLFVLDLSRSMNARDVAPSRLAAAKRAAGEIARALSDDRVGLVIFGGSAFLQLPPTLDHSSLALFLDAATTEDIPDPGTNVGEAVEVAAAAFAHGGAPGAHAIVLLTDGEDRESDLAAAAETLRRDTLHVFAVGIGTLEGAVIPERDSTGAASEHRDWAGRLVTTRLEEAGLRRLALATGGTYVRWSDDASVHPIVVAISQLERHALSSQTNRPGADRFQWPLAIAIAALFAESVVRYQGRERRNAPRRP